jgi:hypothetical protein
MRYKKAQKFSHLNDDNRLTDCYKFKKSHAKQNSIEFLLTFDEYCNLLTQAGITSSQIRPTKYHLARFGDKGPYALGNCRFVPQHVNRAEVDPAKISTGLYKHFLHSIGHFTGKAHTQETKALISKANKKMIGSKNSQFGTCWITDGVKNAKIQKGEITPEGWKLGRIIKYGIVG